MIVGVVLLQLTSCLFWMPWGWHKLFVRVYYKWFVLFLPKNVKCKYFLSRKHYSWETSNILTRDLSSRNTTSSRCFSMYEINQLFAINTGWNVCMIFRSAVLVSIVWFMWRCIISWGMASGDPPTVSSLSGLSTSASPNRLHAPPAAAHTYIAVRSFH